MTYTARTSHKVVGKLLRKFDGSLGSNLPVSIKYTEGNGFQIFSDSTRIGYIEDFWSCVHLKNIRAVARIDDAFTGLNRGRILPIELNLTAKLPDLEYIENLPNSSGIYLIWIRQAGSVYVGQTRNFRVRLLGHFKSLAFGTHKNRGLQDLYIEHGFDAFEVEVIDKLPNIWTGSVNDQMWLADRERQWIAYYQDLPNTYCLNRTEGELIDTKETLEFRRNEQIAKAREIARLDAENDVKIKEEKLALKKSILEIEEAIASEELRNKPLRLALISQETWLQEHDRFFWSLFSCTRKHQINETRAAYNSLKSKYEQEIQLSSQLYQKLKILKAELKSKKTSKQLAHYSRLRRRAFFF